MMLATDLVVLDHFDGSAILVANAVLAEDADDAAAARRLPPGGRPARRDDHRAVPAHPADDLHGGARCRPARWSAAPPPGEYQKAVEQAKEAIRAGECFQIVVGAALRAGHRRRPAGRLPGAAGDQPEPVHVPAALRRLRHRRLVARRRTSRSAPSEGGVRRALLHPIAGTRWRGATPGAGQRAGRRAARRPEGARRARHAGRPGPQRPGPGLPGRARSRCRSSPASSGTATSCTSSRPWSASCATTGRAFDALAATFPAGTLSGAPKVRAMEIIEELEPTRRGLYGGTVGYFGFAGDMDMAIAIRTALLRGRRRLRRGRAPASSPTPTRRPRSRRPATRRPRCWPRSPPPRRCAPPDEAAADLRVACGLPGRAPGWRSTRAPGSGRSRSTPRPAACSDLRTARRPAAARSRG